MAEPFNETDVVRKTYFINESERDTVTPANDAGKVPQLEVDGKLSGGFLTTPTEHTSFPVSVTTKVGQSIVVIAKGKTAAVASATYSLTYDSVVQDSYSFATSSDRGSFTLLFAMTPGAKTADIGFDAPFDAKITILYL